MNISLIAAISDNNVIGKNNTLPWKLPDDLRLFLNLTKTHSCIMGRKCFESIGKPLKDRVNIILSRDPDYIQDGCIVLQDIEDAISISGDNIFILGGAEIYKLALPLSTHFFRTTVHADIEGDIYFPEYDRSKWNSVYSAEYYQDIENGNQYPFTFEILTNEKRS